MILHGLRQVREVLRVGIWNRTGPDSRLHIVGMEVKFSSLQHGTFPALVTLCAISCHAHDRFGLTARV